MPITKLSVTFCNISLIIIIKTFLIMLNITVIATFFGVPNLFVKKCSFITQKHTKKKKGLKDIFEGLKNLLLLVMLQ